MQGRPAVIIFRNPGLIDIRAATVMGINVKEGPSPIGFFGTGLKYAIAVLLRHDCSVTIWRGQEPYRFAAKEINVRGKAFGLVSMNGQELAFTTELGKRWELWQAYREIYCNAVDEGGDASYLEDGGPVMRLDDCTAVVVEGAEFEKQHHRRHEFLLTDEPDFVCVAGEIRKRPSDRLYYRGILIAKLQHPGKFTYNIKSALTLTEDRTLKYMFEAEWAIKRIFDAMPGDLLDVALTASRDSFEGRVEFEPNETRSTTFYDAVARNMQFRCQETNRTAVAAFEHHFKDRSDSIQTFEPEGPQVAQLEIAKAFCAKIGFPVDEYDVVCAKRLAANTLGSVIQGKIWLAERCFDLGTKTVAATLIEEFIHLRCGVADETREMQEELLNRLVSLGEQHVWRSAL